MAVAGLAALSMASPGSRVHAREVVPSGFDLSSPASLLIRNAPVLRVQSGADSVEIELPPDHPLCASGSAYAAVKRVRLFAQIVSDELRLPSLAYRLDSSPLLWSLDIPSAILASSASAGDRLVTTDALRLGVVDWPESLATFLSFIAAGGGVPPLRLVSLTPLPVVRTQVLLAHADACRSCS